MQSADFDATMGLEPVDILCKVAYKQGISKNKGTAYDYLELIFEDTPYGNISIRIFSSTFGFTPLMMSVLKMQNPCPGKEKNV